jgi:serine phosphatase RsbU (regulator of sigma subunit)/pSer/pThr/pTyr-binding forkhead associated (FHA) protein
MSDERLNVSDGLGDRVVVLDRNPFTIGRRETNALRLGGTEVSREHAEILGDAGAFRIRDLNSRYGTFVNGEQVTAERPLKSGDLVRLGRGGGADLVFLTGTAEASAISRSASSPVGELRQVAALLEGLRALGSGRVLQEVLALVLDSVIDLSGAERGFIMLSGATGALEFKLGRSRGKQTLVDATFQTSRKIPEEVFRTGETRVVADLLDGALADVHVGTVALGIRHVLCAPLNLVRYVEQEDARSDDRRIGVLYLDSREKGTLLSHATRVALDTLANEAAVAIENARLYRETLEKVRMENEMRIAAEIQQALLPQAVVDHVWVEAAASSIPCRSIGGDFFDYVVQSRGAFGFTLGDVAGKGPPAALLSALLQGMFAGQAESTDEPSVVVARVNQALYRRGIESRFVTLFFGVLETDGRLTYCNAGHNPPFVIGSGRARRLDVGGPVVGLLDGVPYAHECVQLSSGERIIVFSDGVSEAMSHTGEEFGDDRLEAAVREAGDVDAEALVNHVIAAVRVFTLGAAQSDDITAMVVRYRGETR